jgi:hypothetical protein
VDIRELLKQFSIASTASSTAASSASFRVFVRRFADDPGVVPSPTEIVEVQSEVFRLFFRMAHGAVSAFEYALFAFAALKPSESR